MTDFVDIQIIPPTARATLLRPDLHNAFNEVMIAQVSPASVKNVRGQVRFRRSPGSGILSGGGRA